MKNYGARPQHLACVAILVCVGLSTASALASDNEQPSQRRLSVLSVCGSNDLTHREKLLISELELVLDGYAVLAVDLEADEFADLGEAQQVEAIRASTRNASDTSPVVWLECDIVDTVVVRLFTFDGTTPRIRILSGGSENEVALVISEVVVDAFHGTPVEDDEPTRDAEPVAEDEPPNGQPVAEKSSGVLLGIFSGLEFGGGLVGQEGASFLWGGGFALDIRIPQGFFGRVAIQGKVGPRDEDGEFLIVGHRVEPRLEVGYLWEVGIFGVGPLIALSTMWNSIDFAIDEGYHNHESWWSVRFAAGADMRLELNDRLSIVLDLTLGFMPSKRFYRRMSRETLLTTPTMDMVAALGLVVGI